MRRSRLQAICNMTWGAWYSSVPRPTNERAEVSGYQPAHTDPPLLAKAWGEELALLAKTWNPPWLLPGLQKVMERL